MSEALHAISVETMKMKILLSTVTDTDETETETSCTSLHYADAAPVEELGSSIEYEDYGDELN